MLAIEVQVMVKSILVTILIGFLSLTAGAQSTQSNELKAFSTDGCSASPDGDLKDTKLWQKCCVLHDVWYWVGGTSEQRKTADTNLYQCMLSATGDNNLSTLYYKSVRLGGEPFYLTTYRWGYGWKKNRGYEPIDQKTIERRNELYSNILSQDNFDNLITKKFPIF